MDDQVVDLNEAEGSGANTQPSVSTIDPRLGSAAVIRDARDLRWGRVEVYHTFAIDLSELLHDRIVDRRILQGQRARDQYWEGLAEQVCRDSRWASERDSIKNRMARSKQLRGKQVWTDSFLDRFCPLVYDHDLKFSTDDREISTNNRLSPNPANPLHHVVFVSARMKMFRDATLIYTVGLSFDDRIDSTVGDASRRAPCTTLEAIQRLKALDGPLSRNFTRALRILTNDTHFRTAVSTLRSTNDERGLEMMEASRLDEHLLGVKSREHRILLVENSYDQDEAARLFAEGKDLRESKVSTTTILKSPSLAGLINDATWYRNYGQRYVDQLASKEIGYKADEIYLTDRTATFIEAEGFWHEESETGPADSLTLYKYDLIQAVEYNLSRLAFLASMLDYFQKHPDVHGLENREPGEVLQYVIGGRSILALIEESLDLTLLVNHGFTRVFIARLRREMAFDSVVAFIRQRVDDASTSVGLKASVDSAIHTSMDALKEAVENNKIQRSLKWWAIAAAALAMLALIFPVVQTFLVDGDPPAWVCTRTGSSVTTCAVQP
jgi:hypothetical protein